MSITIVLADDHPLLLRGTEQFLKSKNFRVLDVANNGNEAYNAILKHKPNVAILDFDMPVLNGLEIAKMCIQNNLDVKIIILTLYKQEAIINEIGKTIHGYILKDDALPEIETCIAEISKNNTYVSKNIQETFFLPETDKNPTKELSFTELKVLRFLAKNNSSSEIAELLFISKRTVDKHRSNIIRKLGLKSSQNSIFLWIQKNAAFFEK